MDEIKIGVLTISDRCYNKVTTDESGPNLVRMINDGIIRNGTVATTYLVRDDIEQIEKVLTMWVDDKTDLILTTGGTGISERDVTPEATKMIIEKSVPGIHALILSKSLEVTKLACLSRGVAGVRNKSLIINFPGSKKASQECLEAIADIIPHAVDLIRGREKDIQSVHTSLIKKKSSVVINVTNRNRNSPYPCITVTDAQSIIKKKASMMCKEIYIPVKQALNYILAQEVFAPDDFPPVDVSLMDGYAFSCPPEIYSNKNSLCKQIYRVVDESMFKLDPTESCVRVNTGAPIPSGAKLVQPVEYTTLCDVSKDKKKEQSIRVTSRFSEGANIRKKGSDISKGEQLLKFGSSLDASSLGLLATFGVSSVRVYSKPLVAIISTGDELVDFDKKLPFGKIRDSNRITLLNLLESEQFKTLDLGICPDEPDSLLNFLQRGFQEADVVVTTGNMSMGDRDILKDVLINDFNAEILFGRVLMKPGKPTSCAVVMFQGKEKFWFGLPGNPASAFVTSHLFLLPALRCMSRQENMFPSEVTAILEKDFKNGESRPNYVRAVLKYTKENKLTVNPLGNQQSSYIGGCIQANSLVLIPSSVTVTAGKEINAFVFGKPIFE